METKISFAVKGLIKKDDQYLILKRSDWTPDIWELPGGRLEFGETAQDTLIREMREETGLEVTPKEIIGTFDKFIDNWQITGIIYECTSEDCDVKISPEHNEFKWVSPDSSDFELLHPIYREKVRG